MKKKSLLICMAALASSLSWAGDTYVNGYYRSDGTYVQGHYRSTPNKTKADNWSTKPNTNPYTGNRGTQVYKLEEMPNYGYGKKKGNKETYGWEHEAYWGN